MLSRFLCAIGLHLWGKWSNPQKIEGFIVSAYQTRCCLRCNLEQSRYVTKAIG